MAIPLNAWISVKSRWAQAMGSYGLLCVSLLIAGCQSPADRDPLLIPSFDFQLITPSGEPLGWYVEGNKAKAQLFVNSENASLPYVSINNADEDPLLLYTSLPADTCETDLHVSFEMRSLTEGAATPVILHPLFAKPLFNPPTPANSDWHYIEFQTSQKDCLPPSISIGSLVVGQVDIRHFQVHRGGKVITPYKLHPSAPDDISKAQTVALTPSGFAARLSNSAKRQVIALGEASHGAAGLFTLKFDVIKAFVASGQLGTFALEMPAAASDIINDYVLGQTDNPETVIDALVYPAWQTEEMLDIINWLRRHNMSAAQKVRFAGFDVQHPIWAARGLLRLGVARDTLNAILGADTTEASLQLLADTEKKLSDQPDALRYVRLLRGGLLTGQTDLGGLSRDAYMAEEVMHIANAAEGTILLWADNTHITKIPGSMGGSLKASLKDRYS